MAAIPDTRPGLRPVLVAGVLAAAYLATRIALISRFPWFVDETTFASFAKEVHGDIGSSSSPRATRRDCCPPGSARC